MPHVMSDAAADTGAQSFTERRVVGRALNCWDNLRTTGDFPSRSECLAAFDEGMASGVIVIEVSEREEDDRIVECGPAFRDALGCDPVGHSAKEILPSSTERGLIFWRVAAQMQKPIADIGAFTNAEGREVLYRSVFLPISEKGGKHITHLMAAFSYKTSH